MYILDVFYSTLKSLTAVVYYWPCCLQYPPVFLQCLAIIEIFVEVNVIAASRGMLTMYREYVTEQRKNEVATGLRSARAMML